MKCESFINSNEEGGTGGVNKKKKIVMNRGEMENEEETSNTCSRCPSAVQRAGV